MSRKANEFSEISQVCFRAGWKELTEVNWSAKVTDHFTWISVSVIYCISSMLCKKNYIGETGRRLADRFRERPRDVEKNHTDASKPVARYCNLPNHFHHNMTICEISLHRGTQKATKISNKNSSFNWVHSILTGSMNASHTTNIFTNSCDHISTNGKAPLHSHRNLKHPTIPLFALTKG